MANILLTKHQRFMIPHFRNNVINYKVKDKKILEMPTSLRKTIDHCESGRVNQKILKNIDSGVPRVIALNDQLKKNIAYQQQ